MPDPVQTSIPRREPKHVMRLARLGAAHQHRLSFMRVLTRRMARDHWTFSRPIFEFDAAGVGHAVYTATGPERTYSLVAFGHDLPDDQRSDRVIATAWDATFTLFDGVPTTVDIQQLSQNIPLQEAGRVCEKQISVSRANRSVRLWEHVTQALAAGHQPDTDKIAAVGYLMRTTAVYGSGKLGAADYETIAGRAELRVPFQAEMLSVYLTRTFVRDLANHVARQIGGGTAVKLDATIAQSLGIGNSTGLGLAPYIIQHPVLFNNWIQARETAIARVRSVKSPTSAEIARFLLVLRGTEVSVAAWKSEHPIQKSKLIGLNRDMASLIAHVSQGGIGGDFPWDRLVIWAETTLRLEGQELVASLILEPYGGLIDDLADSMADHTHTVFDIDGSMEIQQVRALIEGCFGWALPLDWKDEKNCRRAWYVSEEKLEPRIGNRFDEPIADFEQPLAPARDAAAAHVDLKKWDGNSPVAEFLRRHPEHRHTIRRAQISACAPYGEIHDNTIAADMLPIDLLRIKLAFFGAKQFDPRSDRWVRICMFADAPYPEDLAADNADFWAYPQVAP